MSEDKTVRKLRKQLETALGKQKDPEAIDLLGKLIEAEPKAPRWPHKRGELYRKHNRKKEAVECYTLAADLYTEQGFIARALAMAKTIIDIDPRATQVLERIDPEAARKLHRQQRPGALSARPAAHPALLAEDDVVPAHPALAPEGPAVFRHAALLPEDDAAPAAPQPAALARGGARVRAVLKRKIQDDDLSSAPPPARAPRAEAQTRRGDVLRIPGPPKLPEFSERVLELAEELTIAPDVQPNETRFSNAPPARAITVDLSDLELEPRKPAPPAESLRPAPPTARSLSQLPLFPLFAEVPQQALIEMVKGAEVLELGDGAVVMRRGDPADALFGIVEGSVDVVVPGQQTKMTLAEGDVFGESCLLAGEKRHADAIVRSHLLALKIPRQVFNQIVGSYPRLAEVLLELLTRRLLGNLLQSSPLFQEFDARGRQELVHRFEVRRAPRNTTLAQIGKVMDGLYINLTGTLEVMYADGRPGEIHESGTMFGQGSLLTHEPSDVTIRSMGNMLLLRLPVSSFQTIAMQYPGLLAHISELTGTSVAKIST